MKLFVEEEGSQVMLGFFYKQSMSEAAVSAVTYVEARSAVVRLCNMGYLNQEDRAPILTAVDDTLLQMVPIAVSKAVITNAAVLVERHRLKTLDALQLACAMDWRTRMSDRPINFVTSDTALMRAAEAEGFVALNPCART